MAILRAGRPRIGLGGAQVQVDGGGVAAAEEVGPEVRVPLGHGTQLSLPSDQLVVNVANSGYRKT